MQPINVSSFTHTQTVPSTLWAVAHNLSSGFGTLPSCDVLVNINGALEKMIPSEITLIDKNNLTVSFSVEQSGIAVVLV